MRPQRSFSLPLSLPPSLPLSLSLFLSLTFYSSYVQKGEDHRVFPDILKLGFIDSLWLRFAYNGEVDSACLFLHKNSDRPSVTCIKVRLQSVFFLFFSLFFLFICSKYRRSLRKNNNGAAVAASTGCFGGEEVNDQPWVTT